jgi:pseudouridylate synthase
MTSLDKAYYAVLPEVEQALERGEPIVALESTVITHGLPYPENQKLAESLEAEIRRQDCIPATIAILDGRIHIGLNRAELEQLVHSREVLKTSGRDIAPAIQAHKSGGTTVAGTLAIAQAAGIKVFATGGIGGVHRGATYDVSADLMQLAHSQLVVVCAGAKAILDMAATLEVLESYGVPVVGYQTDEFPAFYSRSSGLRVSFRLDDPGEVAELAQAHWNLGMPSAVLVAVPPPDEVAVEGEIVERAILTALEEAKKANIRGQAVTPFLLQRMSELTGGRSLEANLGLLVKNARIAGQIAWALHKLPD